MTEPVEKPAYDIEITRVLEAPRERVYQAFTEPDQFAEWYGPVGFPVHRDSVQLDARVGGLQRFAMVSDDDASLRTGFDGRFVEVVPNELLRAAAPGRGFRAKPLRGHRAYEWSFTTTTARHGSWCEKALTRPERPIWVVSRGR
jgi:uncharacterized protein YndB with AHSA1/START domain